MDGLRRAVEHGIAQLEPGARDLTGNLLSFQIDLLNNGTFIPFGDTVDLSTPTYSFRYSTNSGFFFGTGSSENEFNTFTITSTAVPEPASLLLLGLGLSGIVAAKRARQRVTA